MTNEIMSPQTRMLFAMQALNMPVYEGTVAWNVKQRNRAANKVARKSRRINRLRG